MDKKDFTWSMRIIRQLHDDLGNVQPIMEKKMVEEIEDVLMRYAFIASHDYRKPYKGDE